MNLSFEKSLQEKIQKGHFQPYISIKLGLPPPVTSDPYQIKSVKVRLLFSTYFFFFSLWAFAVNIADGMNPTPYQTPY